MNFPVEMEAVDLTASDSEDEFSSFGSQETDGASVVFLVETADISSDESMDDIDDSESGRMID